MGNYSPKKRVHSAPILGPRLLWPNGVEPGDIVLNADPVRPHRKEKGHSPQFSAHVYWGHTAVCIRIPLGTGVCLSLGDIVLDGDPAAPPLKGHTPTKFSAMYIGAKRLNG